MPKKSAKDIRAGVWKRFHKTSIPANFGPLTDATVFCFLDDDRNEVPELIQADPTKDGAAKYIEWLPDSKLFSLDIEPNRTPDQRRTPLEYCLHYNAAIVEIKWMGCETAAVVHHYQRPDGKWSIMPMYIMVTPEIVMLSDMQSRYNLGPLKQNKKKKAA